MKKTFKENFKEIWADEPYLEHKTERKSELVKKISLGREVLEGAINFARFELLFPKMKEDYDFGMVSEDPKGYIPAVIANTLFGAYIGSNISNNEVVGLVMGGFVGFAATFPQGILGSGVRAGVDYISKKCKESKLFEKSKQ